MEVLTLCASITHAVGFAFCPSCRRTNSTTLFAAPEAATGKVIGSLHRRHRAVELKKFLTKLDKEVPPASMSV
ncbi:hypothetical protein [Streptomyces sp. NPDC002328]|uniref:hypothetical protein n=1 Tax=Streptomyces sp. NPDC002328 TaxID=3364642 RepID=UPI0036AF0F1B